MNDLERDLRTLLDEKASTAGAPMPDPGMLRRARRRQVGTVLGGALVALAVVAGAVVAVSALGPGGNRTPADPTGPLVDTTVNGVTVTHPQGWQVVDPVEAGIQPETQTTTRLILLMTDADPITAEAISCPGLTERADTGVAMTIQEVPLALAGEDARPWPVELVTLVDPGDPSAEPSGCLPGWTFLRGSWTANGRSFEARVGFGPDVSDEQRDALEAAFASLRFAPFEGEPEAVVLATGTAGGEAWELIAQRSSDGLMLGLGWASGGAGMGGMAGIEDPLQYTARYLGTGSDRELVVFGATRGPVAQVGYRPSDGGHDVSMNVIDVPDGIDAELDAFILVIADDGSGGVGLLRGYDARARVVAEVEVRVPMDEEDAPSGAPSGGEVVASGEDWSLALDDRDGVCFSLSAPGLDDRTCSHSWPDPIGFAGIDALPGERALVYGFVVPSASGIRVDPGEGSAPDTGLLPPPGGFAYEGSAFAVVLDGASGQGRITVLDAQGNELGFADLSWAPGTGGTLDLTPTSPTT